MLCSDLYDAQMDQFGGAVHGLLCANHSDKMAIVGTANAPQKWQAGLSMLVYDCTTAKAIEKAAVAAGAALPPAPPTRRRHARFARLFSALADEPEALLAAASAGTCLGVVLGALMWRRHG